jgi:hypothetical protein
MQAGQQQGTGSGTNLFDSKTDKGSADLYFHYYGMLQHQQNMLQVNRDCPRQRFESWVPAGVVSLCGQHRR